jgi:hypothetical protein
MGNLKLIKKLVIPSEKSKQKEEELELTSIEDLLEKIYQNIDFGFSSNTSREVLKTLEEKRWKLLADKEATWRLKRKEIWLENGDENTKLFHAYAKRKKAANTIWSLKDQKDRPVTYFKGLANMGQKDFQTLFKDNRKAKLVDIIKLALHFPSFADEEDNQNLFVEVTETELKDTMQSFQKDKISGSDEWTIEFYLGFFELIGKDILKFI